MSGDILPLPQYAFMAWCSVKSTGTIYLGSPNIILCVLSLSSMRNMCPFHLKLLDLIILTLLGKVKERQTCPCALTEHHAMKAYWGVEREKLLIHYYVFLFVFCYFISLMSK
jgi:hypothetical protein